MTNLANYLQDCRDLMRDSRSQFTTEAQFIRYINQARREIAKRSACLEALITGQSAFGTTAQPGYAIPGASIPGALPGTIANNFNEPGAASTAANSFVTIPGVELYSYNYAKPYLQGQYAGYDSVIYVFNISVSWGGNLPTLNWMTWDSMQAYCRSYNLGMLSYPVVWSQKGVGENGQVWMFPVPGSISPGTMEWQCICTPKPLYTNDDYEAIPEIYQGCTKYYACYLAFLGQQRTGMAQIMKGLFDEQIMISGVASDFGHLENYYNQYWPQ